MIQFENKTVLPQGLPALALLLLAIAASTARGQTDAEFSGKIQPVLAKYCATCHGEEQQSGDIRIDDLDPDMIHGKDAETWQLVLDQLNLGDMPPEDEEQPQVHERRALVNWLTAALKQAAEHKQKDTNVVLRRLTNDQYTNSLRD